MTRRNWIAAAILALAAAVPQLAAADYWRYETETGAVAFTDDPKGIPAKYQASARAVQEESLFDYGRLSVVDSDANRAPTRERVGRDEAAVATARTEWKRLKAEGHEISYWQQDENYRWQNKSKSAD